MFINFRFAAPALCLLAACSSNSEPEADDAADLPSADAPDGAIDTGNLDPPTPNADANPPLPNADASPPEVPAGGPCSEGALCDGQGSLCKPTPLCTAERPCENALAGITQVTLRAPLQLPSCRASRAGRDFNDGPVRTWTDPVDGQTRAACVYRPPGTRRAAPRPLVVLLHGAGGNVDNLYDTTSLRAKAPTYDLSGNPECNVEMS